MTATEQPASERQRMEDFDQFLSETNTDAEASIRIVEDNADAIFTWDYAKGKRPALEKLYEKAKKSQWNGSDLDWDTDVDLEKVAREVNGNDARAQYVSQLMASDGSPVAHWGDKEWGQYSIESFAWRLAQFMHGEQGALLATAKIVETVPWIDAKYYASTQVMDEARHVEVFARYLDEKVPVDYPVNHHLQALLDDIIADSRWDITYLGMQIMVEGLALAAFGSMHKNTQEPLLKKLLRYVMSDEARHVAFGVLTLQEVYEDFTQAEIRERQEFAFEAALRMRDRFLQQEVWEQMGADVRQVAPRLFASPDNQEFQHLLFTKIVPNCKKLGLLDAGDGWLRERFGEIGVIQYENWVDTSEEYNAFAIADELASA